MSNASDICAARIIRLNEEGFRDQAYDDATGAPVHAQGVITIGYGCACRGWSKNLARAVLGFQLVEFEAPLFAESWYIGCNDVRRSALLEIAFNVGDSGLERGFPKLIAAVTAGLWPQAQAQCSVRDPRLKARYDHIGQILATGVDA
jgi:GH24 family phage-related lysozyme (muramidase)